MAKKSSVEKNNRRRRMTKKFASRRAKPQGRRARLPVHLLPPRPPCGTCPDCGFRMGPDGHPNCRAA